MSPQQRVDQMRAMIAELEQQYDLDLDPPMGPHGFYGETIGPKIDMSVNHNSVPADFHPLIAETFKATHETISFLVAEIRQLRKTLTDERRERQREQEHVLTFLEKLRSTANSVLEGPADGPGDNSKRW
jgi:uncharacterized coiled-coil protein SlyX